MTTAVVLPTTTLTRRPTGCRRSPPDGRPGVDRPRRRRGDRPRRRRRPVVWGSNFANDYVYRELSSQNIFFPSADELRGGPHRPGASPTSRSRPATRPRRTPASSTVTSQGIADGATYADLGAPSNGRQGRRQEAQANGARSHRRHVPDRAPTPSPPNATRLFKGETLRGLLLSTFAWSTIGHIACIAALVAFVAAAVMAMLVIAGLVHERRLGHAAS